MIDKEQKLKSGIMRRTYAIWFTRKLLSPLVLKPLIVLAFLQQIASRVFVAKVLENAPSMSDVVAFLNFYASAISNTRVTVQLFSIGIVLLSIWLARDIFSQKKAVSWI